VSKERARRRAERVAVLEKEKAARARKVARRQRRRVVMRRMTPRLGSSGRLHRRSRGQRIGIVVVPLAAVLVVWLLVPGLPLRVILTAMIVIAVPALVVLVLGKRA
jgi:Flp pilus assembly protein TadB